jgi:hypothetical protein
MALGQFRKAARFGVVFILLAVYASTQIAQSNISNVEGWHKLDAGPFSISAPSGWEFHQLTGVDSYVGEFVGDGVTLTFDFGRYSTELRHAKKPAYIITKKFIDGRTARVVSPRTSGNGITGVLVHLDGHDALCLWGKNLSVEQEALAFKIFETLRFGGPMPPSLIPPPPPPPAKKAE